MKFGEEGLISACFLSAILRSKKVEMKKLVKLLKRKRSTNYLQLCLFELDLGEEREKFCFFLDSYILKPLR
jgi:hypothetical protein